MHGKIFATEMLRKNRMQAGFTQTDFVKKVFGIGSRSWYCRVENGQVSVSAPTAKRIVRDLKRKIKSITYEECFSIYVSQPRSEHLGPYRQRACQHMGGE